MSHTPGPWTFVENIEGAMQLGVDDAWEVGSETLKTGIALVPGRKANARLIAAAPDLLACCELARIAFKNRDQTPGEANILSAIKLAIAKATTSQDSGAS